MQNAIALGLLLFASSAVLAQKAKPYQWYEVTITSTLVNHNGLRIIYAKGVQGLVGGNIKYIFTCNEDANDCSAPMLGSLYHIIEAEPLYKCDNYALAPYAPGLPPSTSIIRVCLGNVY